MNLLMALAMETVCLMVIKKRMGVRGDPCDVPLSFVKYHDTLPLNREAICRCKSHVLIHRAKCLSSLSIILHVLFRFRWSNPPSTSSAVNTSFLGLLSVTQLFSALIALVVLWFFLPLYMFARRSLSMVSWLVIILSMTLARINCSCIGLQLFPTV